MDKEIETTSKTYLVDLCDDGDKSEVFNKIYIYLFIDALTLNQSFFYSGKLVDWVQ